ncbi:LapA family protein [Amycolatopsis sp.]|jgi:uncharacterized integral membrane protein|uniref:LapA family protein n=1 Tax=Amycolatopsis sp. TaxID=37632 RepID=UPI002E0845CC|nr:lipopolysaccharide assembly protein LapA domain-containing protein [Amycolatopsis sp.]
MTHAQDGKHAASRAAEEVHVPAQESAEDRLPPAPPVETQPAPAAPAKKLRPTRVSGTWVAVIIALLVLVFLLVFILQNLDTASVHFLGMSGSLPLAVAMLFSAIAGALLVALVGGARILQLRKETKKARRSVR